MRLTKKEKLLKELEELEKRDAEKKDKEEKRAYYEKWKERPYLHIIGWAYTDTDVQEETLASVGVRGNASTSYKLNIQTTPSMGIYFHNEWGNELENEFQKELDKLVSKFMKKVLKNPNVVCGLMSLERNYLDKFPKSKRKEVEKEIKKEQARILSKYSYKQLKQVLDDDDVYSTKPIEDFLKAKDKGQYSEFIDKKNKIKVIKNL